MVVFIFKSQYFYVKAVNNNDVVKHVFTKLYPAILNQPLFNLKSAGMFVTIIQNVHQYWCSTEKSNAGVSLDTVSRFFRALPIMACSLDLQ